MSQVEILYFMMLTVSIKIQFDDDIALSIFNQNTLIHMVKTMREASENFFQNLNKLTDKKHNKKIYQKFKSLKNRHDTLKTHCNKCITFQVYSIFYAMQQT